MVRSHEDERAQPRWKFGRLLGMIGGGAELLEAAGKLTRCGSWRHSPDAEIEQNKEELKEAQKKINEPNFKTLGCSNCDSGATKQNKGERTTVCRQVVHDSGVAPSVWTVRYDSGGRCLRGPGDIDDEPRAKRMRTGDPPEQAAGAASSRCARRRLTTKRPPDDTKLEQQPETKEARSENYEAMDCVANLVAESVDYAGKAFEHLERGHA